MLAADVMDRLIDYIGGDSGGDKAVRQARTAILDALQAFPTAHSWRYHDTWARLALSAPYSTGTVVFNSAANTLTLTSGTWPTWAASGHVRINDLTATVATRDSSTVLTMDSNLTFPEDIASTSYSIVREQYDLPANFSSSGAYIAQCPFGTLRYVYPQDWLATIRSQLSVTGYPSIYTFAPSTTVGRYALRIWPPASAVQTLDYFYQRRLRAVTHYNTSDGKVTATSGSATVTGAGTNFRSNMIGAYIRLAANGLKLPTGPAGVNPAVQEYRITAVASTTSLTIASVATDTANAVAYIISDPIDIEDGAMGTFFNRLAIKHIASDARMKDLDDAIRAENDALEKAKDADARNSSRSVIGGGAPRSNRGIWYTALGSDRE